MCGLVSVVSKFRNGFTQRQKDIFSTLLFIDTLRGDDSTGAFTVKNNGDLLMAKDAGAALPFMQSKEYDKLLTTAFGQGAAMVGHNRKATRGVVNDANAHPFVVDDRIVLVHNGTLYGDHKKHADVEVDSHAIAHLLAQHDTTTVVNKINGAFALIWYDFQESKLNFMRNDQRPLYWVETDQEWIWSSEDSMLNFVKDRYNIKFKEEPQLLTEHTLCTYTLNNGAWDIDSTKINHTPVVSAPTSYSYTHRGSRPQWVDGSDEDFGQDNLNQGERCNWQFGNWHRERFPEDYKPVQTSLHDVSPRRKAKLTNGQGMCTVTAKEHELGFKCGRLFTVEEFGGVTNEYPYNSDIIAQAFDATCVNEEDDSDGMFLWLYPADDPNVVFRYRFGPNQMTEEKAISLAAAGAIYSCKINNRAWIRVENVMTNSSPVGWVLFNISSMSPVNTVTTAKGETIVH